MMTTTGDSYPLSSGAAELERLRRDSQQRAGQVGFLQAKLQDAERQIARLSAPKDDAPSVAEPSRAAQPGMLGRWWKRLRR